MGKGLNDCVELFEILKPRKQVKCFIHGHTHEWEVTERDGLHVVGLPAIGLRVQARFSQRLGAVRSEARRRHAQTQHARSRAPLERSNHRIEMASVSPEPQKQSTIQSPS